MISEGSVFQVVEPKYCERCRNTFYRAPVALRKLADGSIVDPNKYCPSCENFFAIRAKKSLTDEVARLEIQQEIDELRASRRSKRITDQMIRRMETECIRKVAFFDADLAKRVAKRSRKVHRGDNPNEFYRCKVTIDPTLYPERARPHWHLGGRSDRKF